VSARAPFVTAARRPLHTRLRPGTLLVATETRTRHGTTSFPAAPLVAAALRRRGLEVHEAPIAWIDRLRHGRVDATDALVVPGRPPRDTASLGVVLAVAGRSPRAQLRARRALQQAAPALAGLSAATRPHTIVLAAPRAACAGVERAIRTVELALERCGPPVYVRHQIVHNAHVLAELERRGARFVDDIGQVPPGATLIFSAHGVAPEVRAAAAERRLNVIDATCPLVSKVHAEARRFAGAGRTVVLIGHDDHEEVVGTRGEAPDQTVVLSSAEEVEQLEVADPHRVAYLTQTTLAVDETEEIASALRARFPAIASPRKSDICFATQGRQDAVKQVASECDLLLVVGSQNSSNGRRLVEVAERHGVAARLIDDESHIDAAWLARAGTIGVSAAASTPERLVRRVVDAIGAFGPVEIVERIASREDVFFATPPVEPPALGSEGTDTC
jgi:4-hydroxy-3-methylbut-2-en-1-yl diphosphate reductase